MTNCTIALAQINAPVKKIEENLETIQEAVRRAAEAGADIICFPELTVCGYCLGSYVTQLAEPIPGPITNRVESIAKRSGITVIVGMAEQHDSTKVLNTELVVSPEGLQGMYRKTHIPAPEAPFYAPGSDVRVFDHASTTFGVITCYDSHFPELATMMRRQGAELLFLPHASPLGESYEEKKARWLRYMAARAYDNAVYVAVCNHVGDGGDEQFPGVTMVLNPLGEVIAEAKQNEEDMLIVELSSAVLEDVRNDPIHHFYPRRRSDLYDIGGA